MAVQMEAERLHQRILEVISDLQDFIPGTHDEAVLLLKSIEEFVCVHCAFSPWQGRFCSNAISAQHAGLELQTIFLSTGSYQVLYEV